MDESPTISGVPSHY